MPKTKSTNIPSPFRYAGGKYYARKQILPLIPEHTLYLELFTGGGSVFFGKDKVEVNILNDIDLDLMNVYNYIKYNPEELINFIKNEPASKDRHAYYRNEFKPETTLQEAGQWYYLNRTSFSGIMHPNKRYWGYSSRHSMNPKKWPDSIRKTSEKLKDVLLLSEDFDTCLENVVKHYTEDNIFVFVDPPYYASDQKDLYAKSFEKEDHIRLAKTLETYKDKVKFLLTYDNHSDIKDMYQWANTEDREWKYTIGRSDLKAKSDETEKGARRNGYELFIKNY